MNPQNPPKQTEIAAALGVSPAAVSQFKKQGCPMASIEAARAWRDQTRNPAQRKPDTASNPPGQPQGGGGGAESFDSARKRLMIAQADKAGLELAESRGQLVIKAEVEAAFFEAARALRDGMTNCARRISADVAGMTTAADCEAVIEREHRALLEYMTQKIRARLGAGNPADEASNQAQES